MKINMLDIQIEQQILAETISEKRNQDQKIRRKQEKRRDERQIAEPRRRSEERKENFIKNKKDY